MRIAIIFMICLVMMISCYNKPNVAISSVPKTHNEEIPVNDTQKYFNQRILTSEEKAYYDKYDILNIDSMKIEGKVGIYDLKDKTEEVFGKPDKVRMDKDFCVSFFNNNDSKTYVYFGKTDFEEDYFGQTTFEEYRDTLALIYINFSCTDKKLKHPSILLNKNTKLKELQLIFPKSFANRYELKDGKKTMQIVVPFLTCEACDDKFLLIFENDRLIGIENHMDC